MELRKPPPVRRLTPATVVTPRPESSDAPTLPLGPATNGNGASHAVTAPQASAFVSARRAARVPVPTIDRMHVDEVRSPTATSLRSSRSRCRSARARCSR